LRAVGGRCHPKDIISEPFNKAEQNGYLEILLDIFGALIVVEGGMVALLSLSTVKKVFQFQIN